MYRAATRWALGLLKVPPEPHAPVGDPASLRVFNAGRNYFRLRLAGWFVAQVLALAGILFWTALLLEIEKQSAADNQVSTSAATNEKAADPASNKVRRESWKKRAGERIGKATIETEKKKVVRVHPWNGLKQAGVEVARLLPSGAFVFIWAVKIASFLIYLAQIPLTYAIRRLDYEMRWYMVTDRSLRLRSGIWRVSEATMSFANIQQVHVSQGPLQRLLGLADVKVTSAGGGSGGHHHHESRDMHTGLFQNVANAAEIRDLILERLRRFREAGLGDPEETRSPGTAMIKQDSLVTSDVLVAARELAEEARALRGSIAQDKNSV